MRIKTMLLVVSMSFLMCFMNPMEASACRPRVFYETENTESVLELENPLTFIVGDIHTTKGKLKKTKKRHHKKHQIVEKWIIKVQILSGFQRG